MRGKKTDDPRLEFARRIRKDPQTGCWIWTGQINEQGYGRFYLYVGQGGNPYAHRFAYYQLCGRTPAPKTEIDHLCRNPLCVNPAHLEEVTPRVNNLRSNSMAAINSRKVVCMRGHPFTPENTMVNRHGWRTCRTCFNRSANEGYHRRKNAMKGGD